VHEANISYTSVFRIVTQTVQNREVAAKWVLHQLSKEQKAAHKRVAAELLWHYKAEGEQFLIRNVATDETWIRDFEPQLISHSSQWKQATSPRPKKCCRQQSKIKLITIMAYDKIEVIATDKVPRGFHCNSSILQKVSARCFASKDSPKNSIILEAGVLILHDNAWPHASGAVLEILEKYGWQVLPHPPYSPDMSPPDSDLFQN